MWWPEHPRLRRKRTRDRAGNSMDWMPVDFADGLGGLAIAAVLAVGVLLLFTLVFPLVALGLEVILVVVLFLGGLAGRFLLGHPWTVRAKGPDGRVLEWKVKGFGASGRARDEAAQALANGEQNPRPADALA